MLNEGRWPPLACVQNVQNVKNKATQWVGKLNIKYHIYCLCVYVDGGICGVFLILGNQG